MFAGRDFSSDPRIVLDCAADRANDLVKHLKMYKLRRKIKLEVMEEHKTVAVFVEQPKEETTVQGLCECTRILLS